MKGMNKSEIKYIILATIFAFIFFVLVLPNVMNYIEGINPFIQFMIFNVGIFVLLQIFLKSLSLGSKIKLIYGIGIILLFMAIDIMIPPLLISPDGSFNTNIPLGQSSSDYIFGYFWSQIGLTGFLIYLFTYVVTPLILFVLSGIILKNFVKDL